MIPHSDDHETHAQYAGDQKGTGSDGYAIGKTLQPAVHGEVGDRPRDNIGDQRDQHEFLREQLHEAVGRGTEGLANADFTCPLLCCV